MPKAPDAANIEISAIRVAKRLREVDQDNVDLLTKSLDEIGLLTPLWVREAAGDGHHSLIAGAHRLAAAKKLGWAEVPCLVFSVSKLDAKLLEIDENLIRRELSELDRAVFLAERKAVYEALHPETKKGGYDRESINDKFVIYETGGVPCFVEATAVKLRVDKRTVSRSIARAANIPADVRKLISSTWIANKGVVLDALARLPHEQQRAVAPLMLKESGPRAVSAALAEANGEAAAPADEADLQLATLLKAWRRAGKKARDEFIKFLACEEPAEAA